MRPVARLLLPALLALAAGCGARDERQWMKVDQPYTVEEFRRDVAACTRSGRLDDACMQSRGWVSVTPSKTERAPASPEPSRSPRY